MIPYYILAIEDETDRAYMTALFFQYQKLMYSTIQKVTNDHWLMHSIKHIVSAKKRLIIFFIGYSPLLISSLLYE